mmetsp:Transcript_47351/g.119272  ORF Transcript_47351/g.119272 Transcript_47351/m.119272 type:complete len:206 (-) Transcript_47351:59-676(-)|eukprot:CAMPEP_0177645730 /NCGR_PEP_ID=MMETSP0447-20121125/9402_1 /TAXON_ID=0 /ORGANISM="Stygamoeba regulata, Strain BSH-02190019" /LENGTH=205 /DNA_ID=CAMNT_0019148227 /DNA_START=91 /DNA_END=708 /DNA_ORIENTATION=-
MSTDEVKIEEVAEDVEDVTEDVEDDVEGAAEADGEAAGSSRSKQNRAEKKCRRALQKLGLREVSNVNRVTAKCQNNLFVIAKPDVFRVPNTDTYIVFGEPKIEDMNANAAAKAASQFQTSDDVLKAAQNLPASMGGAGTDVPDLEPAAAAAADDADVDATGLEDSDISIIQSQTSCSRAVAVQALKSTNGDLVAAILRVSEIDAK